MLGLVILLPVNSCSIFSFYRTIFSSFLSSFFHAPSLASASSGVVFRCSYFFRCKKQK